MHKNDFPIFTHHPDLTYLDSAATSLTPQPVLDAMNAYYEQYNANVARGLYAISEQATQEYEEARDVVASFIGAQRDEIIFTSGTTASLNMLAHGLQHLLTSESNIAVTAMDHHANFVPWQQILTNNQRPTTDDSNKTTRNSHLSDLKSFRVIRLTSDGHIDLEDLVAKVDQHTKIIAFPFVSNVLGTIVPVQEVVARVKAINPEIITVVDAAQAAPHVRLNLEELGCDFLAFSAHKMCGPTGVGVLWGRKELLEQVQPVFTGGEMIAQVRSTETTFADLPHRLEAGTPNIAGVIGLKAAVRYLESIGMDTIHTHERELTTYAMAQLTETFGDDVTLYGPKDPKDRAGVLAFTYKSHHPHDIAAILDHEAHVAIRAGQHCAMPLHLEALNIPATARASFYLYNIKEDVDQLIEGLKKVDTILA